MATRTILLPIPPPMPHANVPAGIGFSSTHQRPYLTFDNTTDEYVSWAGILLPDDYVGTPVLNLVWSATSVTSGNVGWGAQIMAYTPETDTAALITDSPDSSNNQTDAHLGTTADRGHKVSISLTNDDGLAAGDYMAIILRRYSSGVTSNIAEDVRLWSVNFTYQDA